MAGRAWRKLFAHLRSPSFCLRSPISNTKVYIGRSSELLAGGVPGRTSPRTMIIQLKRVYDSASETDGCRILVDRVWPRGIRKEEARIDLWLRQVAPSPALRKWFGHDPSKWEEFKERYFVELDERIRAVEELVERAKKCHITLIYSARDVEHNNAVALQQYLKHRHPHTKNRKF